MCRGQATWHHRLAVGLLLFLSLLGVLGETQRSCNASRYQNKQQPLLEICEKQICLPVGAGCEVPHYLHGNMYQSNIAAFSPNLEIKTTACMLQ